MGCVIGLSSQYTLGEKSSPNPQKIIRKSRGEKNKKTIKHLVILKQSLKNPSKNA